LLVEICK